MEKSLEEATAVKQLSSHIYSSHFPDDWAIGKVPHGGYVTSVFLKVAAFHFESTLNVQNQPHTIALHLDFLRRTEVGEALFTVRDVKLGRQTSVIHVTLSQGQLLDREEVVAYITNSNMTLESGVSFSTNYQLNPPPLPVDLDRLKQDNDEQWARQGDMPFAEFRKASTKVQFHFPRKGQAMKSVADEWIRLKSGERWKTEMIGYLCDMWPMPVEAFIHEENPYAFHTQKGQPKPAEFWYPTVLLNLDFKKTLPEEGVEWLFVRVAVKQIRNGRMDLDILIQDEGGEIVALSHHVALVVSSKRNTGGRKSLKI